MRFRLPTFCSLTGRLFLQLEPPQNSFQGAFSKASSTSWSSWPEAAKAYETSVILEGVENDDAKYSPYSTVHGAGRVMGRMEAKGKVDRKTGEVKRVGRVTQDMMDGWLKRGNVELRGAGLDESPDCYKRLPDVLAEHGDSIKILHTLTPVGVAMAGANECDPYKH